MIVNPDSSRLHASTVSIDDPGSLVDFLGPRDAAFLRGRDGFVALGEITRFETSSINDAEAWWKEFAGQIEDESEIPGTYGTGPIVHGSFCFDPLHSTTTSVMVVPRTIIGRRGGVCWMTQLGLDRVTPKMPPRAPAPQPPEEVTFCEGSCSEQDWLDSLREIITRIQAGEAEKVVLARDVVATTTTSFDPRFVLGNLAQNFGGCWNYLIDGLVGSTPEMLVRRCDGMTTSRVLAGTMARLDSIDDAYQASRLIASTKDLAEHGYAVASVIDALGTQLRGLHVPEAPYVLTLPNVMHLATDVCGISDPEVSTLSLANTLHPTAAVCGTPTDVARDLIASYERMDRGRYAGPTGWMDTRGDGEWALALRCGQLDPDDHSRMTIYAGAGVVASSDPHFELVETDAKMHPMRMAITGKY